MFLPSKQSPGVSSRDQSSILDFSPQQQLSEVYDLSNSFTRYFIASKLGPDPKLSFTSKSNSE